jgi:hypothetical protein
MFNKSNLAVAACASKRGFGDSVLFYEGGTIATNGHLLMKVSRPEGDIADAPLVMGERPTSEFAEFCVSPEDIKTVQKGISKKETGSFPILKNAFVIVKGGETKLAATDLSSDVAVRTLDAEAFNKRAKEPEKMVPDKSPVLEIKFNGNSLSVIVDAFRKALDGQHNNPIVFKFWDDCSPALLEAERFETGQKIIGLIMPMEK